MDNKIRVRIAPSPTGYLHIGTARTALFNFLYAKSQGGKFWLRIDDTDQARSKPKYTKDILENLKWLGINWDNKKIIYQSQRSKIYQKWLNKLLENGLAYYCNCPKERLEKLHNEQKLSKQPPRYNAYCREKKLNSEDSWQTIRFNTTKVIDGQKKIIFDDKIRGKVSIDPIILDDFVIANRTGALYNFTSIVDDHLLNISHIIRGEDHISNTPKQILIGQALGFTLPKFAHLPLILNPDRSKMSKRSGDTQVQDYKKKGYLPEALLNFLALLGWHPDGDQEIIDQAGIIKQFSLKKIQKSGAIFDLAKLNWLNSQYIKNLSNDNYLKLAMNYVGKDALEATLLFKDRLNNFSELKKLTASILTVPEYSKNILNWKGASKNITLKGLRLSLEILKSLDEFTKKNIEAKLKVAIKLNKLSNGEVLWPLRVALSGREQSPPPFDIAKVIGKKESLARIKKAINLLK